MKSFIKKPYLFFVFALTSSGIIKAEADSLQLEVLGIQPSKYVLTFEGSESATQLRIMDSEENLLWKDSFTGRVKKIYNFNNLPEGAYQVIIEDESSRIVQPFVKEKDRAIMESDAQFRIEYPSIDQRIDEEILIDLTGYSFSNKARIIFEDLDQEYRETYTLKDGRVNLFKLENLPQGHYEVKLLVGDKIINRTIIL